jgi:PAS domain S-box-containing protein
MSLKKLFIVRFGIQFLLVVVIMILTLLLFKNQRSLAKSRAIHFESYLLADELRQSSDDLTRMARAYVVTGNAKFEREYWTVLSIRNGESPRPLNYNHIYWDFVEATGQKPRQDGKAISLHDLMVNEGFTQTEFDKLALAQRNSDGLVSTEKSAMNAVKGLFDDGSGNFTVKKKPDREMAIRIMFGEAYYKTKAEIMKPIDDFYLLFEKRTDADISKYENRSTNFLLGIIMIIALILVMFLLSFVAIKRQLTARDHAEENLIIANKELTYQITERKQAEEVLKESERVKSEHFERMNEAQHIAKLGSWEWNMQTNNVWWSDETYRIFGVTPQDFVPSFEANGKFIHPNDFARYGKSFEHSIQTGEPLDVDLRLVTNDGLLKHCHGKGKIIYDDSGQPIHFIGTMMDITERKQAEKTLQENEERFRSLYENSTVGIYRTTPDGKIILANPTLVKLLGYSSFEELSERNLEKDGFEPSYERTHFMDVLKREGEVKGLESAWTRMDGTTLFVSESARAINDKEGKIIYYDGIVEDITLRKKAEQELIIANKDLTFQNEEKEERAAELIIANKELAFQNEEKEKRAAELIIANKELAFQNEEKEKWAAELEIKVEERTKQLTETNKKLFEAKSEAEQANQAKSEFLANMSHEIRTPMNAVLGYTELLSSTVVEQTQKDYINSIKSSGRSLLTLINDILDLSKIEAGKLEMEYDYVDTYSFFSEFERIFSLKVIEKDLKFILDITSGTPQGVYIDEARVRQIVFNLIGNAIKFTSEGKITLKVYTENPQIVSYSKEKTEEFIDLIIEVKDTGIGISKELQEAIFEPFVQERDYKHYGGTGLGLAITRRLTTLMNGTISLQSKLGKGSTFTVRIPELPYLRDFSKTTVDIQIDPSEIIFEKAVILIADDVQHNRSYLRDALKNTNLEIVEAEDGLEAYKLAKEIVPDLIIADIRMPKMDGFQLLNKLKTDKKLKHIPAIAYSASVLKSQKERIHKSEFAGLLIKPVKVAELYIELMNFLPFKSTRETEPDKPLSEVDLIREITDLPGLIQSLETSFYATWKTFAVTQSIREIREFGKNLSQLGLDHNSNIITGYGKDLISAADSFNIGAILKLTGKYKGIIGSLKESTKNISYD